MSELDNGFDDPGEVAGPTMEQLEAQDARANARTSNDSDWGLTVEQQEDRRVNSSDDGEGTRPNMVRREQPQQPQHVQEPDGSQFVSREQFNGVYQALQAQRAAAQEAARQRDELVAQMQNGQADLLRRIAERTGAVEPQPEPVEVDPISQLATGLSQIQQQLAQREWEENRQRAVAQAQQAIQADIHRTREQAPDFDDAVRFTREQLLAELQQRGYQPEQAVQAVHHWDRSLVSWAFQNGLSPAQQLYDYARQRGYQPAAQQQQRLPPALARAEARYNAAAGVPGGERAARAPNGAPRTIAQLAQLSEGEYLETTAGMTDAQVDRALYQMFEGG